MIAWFVRLAWTALALTFVATLHAGDPEEAELAQKIIGAQLPLGNLAEPMRSKVMELLRQPAIYQRGPIEAFPCKPSVYHWLLDHPHLAARAWRAIGAKCAVIERRADGSFTGTDPQGGEVRWQAVLADPGRRVWFAEGTGRPAPLAPLVSMRALVILNYEDVKGIDGRVGIRHRAEVIAQLEGRGTSWLTKLGGSAIDQSARKSLEQIELFFSGMSWHLCTNPGAAEALLGPSNKLAAAELQGLRLVLQDLGDASPLTTPAKPQ